jgi:hypothetical protein
MREIVSPLSGIRSPFSGRRAFSPLSLFASGEQGAWYDPSDLTTLFQDSAGLTPVTATGQPVGRINDKSGRGNHASQSTPGARPLLQQEAGGQYYLAFDGTDDSFSTNNINFSTTNKLTVFAGVTKLSDAAYGVIAELTTSVDTFAGSMGLFGANQAGYYFQTGVAPNRVFGPGSPPPIAFATAAPTTDVVSVVYDRTIASSTSQIQYRIDGQGPSSARLTLEGVGASGAFANGALFIGRRNNTNLPLNGRIYSLIVLGRTATAAEIGQTEAWVNGKTGAY